MKKLALASMLALTMAGCAAETAEPPPSDEDAPSSEVKVTVDTDSTDTQSRASQCRRFLYKCMAQPNPHDAYCLAWMELC